MNFTFIKMDNLILEKFEFRDENEESEIKGLWAGNWVIPGENEEEILINLAKGKYAGYKYKEQEFYETKATKGGKLEGEPDKIGIKVTVNKKDFYNVKVVSFCGIKGQSKPQSIGFNDIFVEHTNESYVAVEIFIKTNMAEPLPVTFNQQSQVNCKPFLTTAKVYMPYYPDKAVTFLTFCIGRTRVHMPVLYN